MNKIVNKQPSIKWRSLGFLGILVVSGVVYSKAQLAVCPSWTTTACGAIKNTTECENVWSFKEDDPATKGNVVLVRCEVVEDGANWNCKETTTTTSCPELGRGLGKSSNKSREKNKPAPAKRSAPAKELIQTIKKNNSLAPSQ